MRGPQLHGAVFGVGNENLHLHDLHIEDFLWSGIRTFSMKNARIHDCRFVDAGGRWKRGGIPGEKGGITGGAIFAIWMKDSEISHNRFERTQTAKADEFYGIKVRQAKRCRIHHNTINVNFSLELPFEIVPWQMSRSTTTSATARSRFPSTPAGRCRKVGGPSISTTIT